MQNNDPKKHVQSVEISMKSQDFWPPRSPYETTKRQGRWIWADFFDRFLSLKWDKMHNKCKDLYLKQPLLKPSLELWKIGSRLYRQLSWRPKAHFLAFRSLYTRDTKKTCKPAENTNFSARRKMPPRGRLCRLYKISTLRGLRECKILADFMSFLHCTPKRHHQRRSTDKRLQRRLLTKR